jgi:hypothetical protein
MLVYGRYVEVVTPILVAIGLVVLASRSAWAWARRIVVALALLTAAVILIRASSADPGEASRWNISALPFVSGQLGPAILAAAGLVGGFGAWLLLRFSRAGTATASALAVALFAAVAIYGTWNPVATSQRGAYPSGWVSPEAAASAEPIAEAGYDLDRYDTFGLYATQWFCACSTATRGRPTRPTCWARGSGSANIRGRRRRRSGPTAPATRRSGASKLASERRPGP